MTPRSLASRLLSPAGFGLALLLLLLPIVTVSCGSVAEELPYKIDYTFTGLDLVTGGPPEISGVIPNDDGAPMTVNGASDQGWFTEQVGRPVQPLAVTAAVILVAGLIAGLVLPVALRGRVTGALALAALTLLVVQVLAIAPARAAEELAELAPDPTLTTHTTPAIGFYLTVGVLLALLGREVVTARRPPAVTVPSDPTGPSAQET